MQAGLRGFIGRVEVGIDDRVARAASGEAETTDAGECRACGFPRVRLCAGVG
jgi:hypothetical protein